MQASTDRQSYRALVADVAARATARLPECNGRVERAVKLVLAQDVTMRGDGTAEVGSSSNPLKTYTVAGSACDCQDFQHNRAPQGWCAHRLAVAMTQRVGELLAADVTTVTNGVTTAVSAEAVDMAKVVTLPEAQAEVTPVTFPVTASASAPAVEAANVVTLPEAPASVNVGLTIAGREVQLTLRDHDEVRLLVRLEELLQRFPKPQAPPPASQAASQPQGPERRFCPKDGQEMQLNTKEGRSWWSHKTAEGWCKGK